MLKQIPGFRSGTRWKQILAVTGYVALALMLLLGNLGIKLFVTVILFAIVVATTEVVRARIPGFRSSSRPRAISSWAALAAVGLVALAAGYPASGRQPSVENAEATSALESNEGETSRQPGRPTVGRRPTNTPRPTAGPRPTNTPLPTEQAAVALAVLGAPKSDWILAKGAPVTGPVFGEQFGGDTDVQWQTDANAEERARHIELLFSREVPVAQARQQASALHPPDAQSIRSYTAPAGQTVEVFHSAQLAEAFEGTRTRFGSLFGDAEPGTFIQIAERGSPTTARVVLGLGDNP